MGTTTKQTPQIASPADFLIRFPQYVYRNHRGVASAQWRQAALDMANDRAKLVKALRAARGCTVEAANNADRLLRELGELE